MPLHTFPQQHFALWQLLFVLYYENEVKLTNETAIETFDCQ